MNNNLLFIFDGAYAYSPKRFKVYKEYSENFSRIPENIKRKLAFEKKVVSYPPILDLVFKSTFPKTHEIIYSSQIAINKSIKKINKIININDYKIDIVGYSWGCDASMRFIRYLKEKGIKVNKVFTLDPIRRGPFFAGFIKSINSNDSYFTKESNVSKHFNIYQKTDRFSLPLMHLRGNSIDKADYNFNLSKLYNHASHTNLHTFIEVQEFLNY